MQKSITKNFEFFEFIHLISNNNERFLLKLWTMGNKEMQSMLIEYTTTIITRNPKTLDLFYNNTYLILSSDNTNYDLKNFVDKIKYLYFYVVPKAVFNQFSQFNLIASKLLHLRICHAINFIDETLKKMLKMTPKLKTLEIVNNIQNNNFSDNVAKYFPKKLQNLIFHNKNMFGYLTCKFIDYLPTRLVKLTLSYGLTEIPDSIENLVCLKYLNLEYNNIKTVSEKIGMLKNLEMLKLECNLIESLPNSIGMLENLKSLNLSYNIMIKNPAVFENILFKKIQYLNLSYNRVYLENNCNFPNLLAFVNLKKLDLAGNKLNNISETIGFLINLTELNLNDNSLQYLPNCFENLTTLTILNLSINNLEYIPKYITTFTNLIDLNMASNSIKKIPKTIGNLKKLKYLILSSNKIQKVPEEIAQLTSLKILLLDYNNIETIPKQIIQMKIPLLNWNK